MSFKLLPGRMCATWGDYCVTKNHMGGSYAYCAIFGKTVLEVVRDVSLTDEAQQDSVSVRLMNLCRQHAAIGSDALATQPASPRTSPQ